MIKDILNLLLAFFFAIDFVLLMMSDISVMWKVIGNLILLFCIIIFAAIVNNKKIFKD